eukprot:1214997-Alexandrium_andersonii.AAC.1
MVVDGSADDGHVPGAVSVVQPPRSFLLPGAFTIPGSLHLLHDVAQDCCGPMGHFEGNHCLLRAVIGIG